MLQSSVHLPKEHFHYIKMRQPLQYLQLHRYAQVLFENLYVTLKDNWKLFQKGMGIWNWKIYSGSFNVKSSNPDPVGFVLQFMKASSIGLISHEVRDLFTLLKT